SRVLRLVKGVLGNRYNVATAINGKVAMKFLENKETDLILLDYEMPGESGAQILQRIRSNPKLQKLPVVFLTGVTERKRIKEVLELAPQGYLLKPIDTGRLYVTLEKLLGE
ncbi:MAG: response regulator, partial [Acetatifactor sp.]|nr:response regulator [Acetatifactor sp.]